MQRKRYLLDHRFATVGDRILGRDRTLAFSGTMNPGFLVCRMMSKRAFAPVLLLSALLAVSCAAPIRSPAPEPTLPQMQAPSDLLFWTPAEREAGFRAMDQIVTHRPVATGETVRALPQGEPLSLDVDTYMREHKVAGLLVLQNGRIRLERYGLNFSPDGRWTSFSVAKSLTSTLVGAAIADGYIESLETPIVRYLPELAGSAYDGVTVRQLLTMQSGADWNEDYEDPDSDVARFFGVREVAPGVDPTLDYMRQLKRAAEPGTRWHYSTGETNLVGVLVARATGKHLADYLSEKIWQPYGMEREAAWQIDENGQEPGGCCVMASLRDWGRVGQFMLEQGRIGTHAVVPDGWFAQATTRQADTSDPRRGYGFQWWTLDSGAFQARGIFGQMIHIDPTNRLVVVLLSAWPVATSEAEVAARDEFLEQIEKAVRQP